MVKNFAYNNIILYAKGWYERSENIIEDLGYLLSNVYGWKPNNEYDVAHMLLISLDKLYAELNISYSYSQKWFNTHASFEEEVRKRMRIYEYSRDMAIISLVLSIFQGLSKEEVQLNPPHYGRKEHFRIGCLMGKYPISMTYKQMNKMAEKVFKR